MKVYTEISGKIENGMWGYYELPGLESIIPGVRISTIATVEKDGFFASSISLSSITGTYVEAGSHMLKDGKNIDEYSIEDFIRPAKIIRLPVQKEKALIDASLLEKHARGLSIEKGNALIIDTGWGSMWNREGYVLSCPNYLKNALEWVLDKNISIFGVDVPCIEASWSEDDSSGKGSLLGQMFMRGVLLVAPLVNLDKIRGNTGVLYCFPMNVASVSGAPARVVFEEEVES